MNHQMPFEQVWELLYGELASSKEVFNWTRDKGYFGENFAAQWEGSYILCTLPSSREIRVPQDDFEKVYKMWLGYVRERIPRKNIRDVTFYSKYIISILHQFIGGSD